MNPPTNQIICGDCLEVMSQWPDGCIDCCVTSPPYWGLRDYGVAGQLGLEKTPEEYVEKMVAIFAEIKRVLKPEGTLWLNMGDSYANSGRGGGGSFESERPGWQQCKSKRLPRGQGRWGGGNSPTVGQLKPKDLVGMPWMVAFALRADGWYLRQDIIWNKPNPMPESVRDRCTKAHEYIFLLSKSGQAQYWVNEKTLRLSSVKPFGIHSKEGEDWEYRVCLRCDGAGCRNNRKCIKGRRKYNFWASRDYCYDAEAIKEKAKDAESYKGRRFRGPKAIIKANARPGKPNTLDEGNRADGKTYVKVNKRSVWTVPTAPFPEAHFATYPPNLIVDCIKASCPKEVCKKCGKPRERIVEKAGGTTGGSWVDHERDIEVGKSRKPDSQMQRAWESGDYTCKTLGFTDCGCGAGFRRGIVLDPFAGSNTTGMVAYENGRDYVAIELNPEYIEMDRGAKAQKKMALFEAEG